MESAFEDANVSGYEYLVGAITNDPKDRHVLAAAVRCGAHAIITHNVKHFQPESARPYDLDVLTPDDFLVHQFHFDSELLTERLLAQAVARGIDITALIDKLEQWAPNASQLLQ